MVEKLVAKGRKCLRRCFKETFQGDALAMLLYILLTLGVSGPNARKELLSK
jgi:hypothetical protein